MTMARIIDVTLPASEDVIRSLRIGD